jgi:hypothetical protein
VRTFVETTGQVRKQAVTTQQNLSRRRQHSLIRLPPTQRDPRPAKRCKQCSKPRQEKKTVFCCADCPGNPSLCPAPCFGEWHSAVWSNRLSFSGVTW